MAPRSAPSTDRGGQVLNGIGALAVVALIITLPLALIWAAGNPLPGLVDWFTQLVNDPGAALGDLAQAMTSRDDGGLFLQTLEVIAWVAVALSAWGWMTFVVAFVVELITQLRGRRHGRIPRSTVRIPGMRLQQRAAAALVAAIIGVIAAPTLASAAIPPTLNTAAIAAAAPAGAPSSDVRVVTPEADASQTAGTVIQHEVQRGQGLLDIAEQYRVPWQRLAEANYGVIQPDGRSLEPGHTRVYPGWILRVPTTGTAATFTLVAAETTASSEPMVYRIARGDWLSGIAERFLGDPDRYGELAALNPQLEQRDTRFPDHIERGWQLTLPGDARDRGSAEHARGTIVAGVQSPSTQGPTGSAEADPGVPGEQPDRADQPPASPPASPAPAIPSPTTAPPSASTPVTASPSTTTAPSPTATASSQPSAAPSSSSTAATSEAPPAGPPDQADEDVDSDAVVIGSLAGAGLLSALLLTAVLRRRHRQRQHRRPRRRLPHPQGGATERALRVAEQPADVERLDNALRSLAGALADREQSLPDIAAAWILGQTVTVVLVAPCPDPPDPWTEDGSQWTLAADATLPAVDEQLAPLPTLVTVGSQPGRHLLLDLERLGSLAVAGDGERTLGLLRYLASELACNTWSDDVDVILAGFPVEETELLIALNPDRVRAVSSVSEAANRLRRRAMTVTSALDASGAADTFAGRITDVGEAWAPQVLIVAEPDARDLAALDELGQELREAGRRAVAVVTSSVAAVASDRHSVTVTADGVLHLALPFLRAQASAAGLPVRELEPLAEIMSQARVAADEPTPPAPEPEAWAEDTDAAGAVLNLFGSATPTPMADPPAPIVDDGWAEPVDAPDADPQREPVTSDPIVSTARVEAIPAVTTPRREVTAAIRQRRRQADPQLDADLRAWREQDSSRPRIGILGPVTVDAPGPAPDQRRRFHAEIIVYLAQRGNRGSTGDQLSAALWPEQQVKDASRRVAITRARRWLGETPDGTPWLPEMGSDRLYRLEPGYLLDWHLFRRLRSRGESHGPAGVKDLRAALDLVRGAPLDGADRAYAAGARNPFTWLAESDIYPGHVTSAIVDTAHQLAELHLDAGDTTGARWAVERAWLADPHRGDDEPWRDLMRAARADGHTAELRGLLGELMRAREAEVPEDLSPDTYAWLRPLLPDVLSASIPVG